MKITVSTNKTKYKQLTVDGSHEEELDLALYFDMALMDNGVPKKEGRFIIDIIRIAGGGFQFKLQPLELVS
jgi:hypothetical protein